MKISQDTISKLQSDASLTHCGNNGIISQRMAGKIRYLDSREDEQLRGITMEASAISLYFRIMRRQKGDEEKIDVKEHLINLIDSPGHIDFSSEVSTSSRLCDGAIYSKKLGFSQNALAKTLWGDFYLDMKNKKIASGKKLKGGNPKPLFVSLILDQIWAVYENCLIERNQEKLEKIIEKLGAKISPRDMRSKDLKNLLNQIMSQWIPLSHAVLGTVIDNLPSPVEAQSERIDKILEETIYSAVEGELDKSKLVDPELVKAMRECDSSHADTHTMAYVSKLISVPNEELPKETERGADVSAEELRERAKIARELAKKASEAAAVAQENRANDEYTIKPKKDPFDWEFEEEDFEQEGDEEEMANSNETLIGFTRVYSGTLSKGQKLTVVGPKYDPSLPRDHEKNVDQCVDDVEIKDLFLIMGRELVRMDHVPAGNIVGVVGLDNAVLKNATLCSQIPDDKPYINFSSTSTLIHNKPIMRITVEPTNPMKLAKLEHGLDLLAKADPVLEWYIDDESGELIVCVSGELHLERCLKDLEERFAKGCEVSIKEPVIPFRESLADDVVNKERAGDQVDEEQEEDNELVSLEFDVSPLPNEITQFLISSEGLLNEIAKNKGHSSEVKSLLCEKLISVVNQEQAFRVGPNILLDKTNKLKHLFAAETPIEAFPYENNILNGAQLALNEGPLAAEPMQGVIVILKRAVINDVDEDKVLINRGKIINQTKALIHKQFLSKSPRLLLAMYTCEIQAAAEVLGKVYAVVQKREGSIISEEMKEGTPFFTVVARIPVIQAFGFSEDIRKKTSGAASPQLVFDGYDVLDIDPFWVPHTEEELEELGEYAERENVARRYMNNIRRRKGYLSMKKSSRMSKSKGL
ncbi:Elongation factor Tu GTP binding domain family protein [Candida parapsilosis]|uniref:Elongation factor-like 1 n=1 Tax=Candida parapsilosis TaxID=5480 RepID=A0A8X7NQV1_CANPA|nr:Elongation factor Tu GTP binding domain family protein [Candida parapsilosis]